MTYKENPKTKGSGVICAIPQKGECPLGCKDCFYNGGRSFLEPLEENTPNMPTRDQTNGRIVRVNDGHDSSIDKDIVIAHTKHYWDMFFNTAIPKDLEKFQEPVVLTINPAKMTDVDFYKLDPIPKNLMFVRIRTNMWNMVDVVRPAVDYYTERRVPIVLTFMAYYDTTVPKDFQKHYIFKKRTLNAYWVIRTYMWKFIMDEFWKNDMVYSCSKIEGEEASRSCARCGNCLREYFVTKERLRNVQ